MQSRIAQAAEELFVAKGFEETTVDEIAAAVGMSQRSFFRYFASKDELVLDRVERLGEELARALDARPPEEPEWDSLRRSFDAIAERLADPVLRERDQALRHIVDTSPRLFAAYLGRLDRMQRSLAERLLERAVRSGREPDELVLRALVGCAFACLHVVMVRVAAEPDDFGQSLDRAMEALRPAAV